MATLLETLDEMAAVQVKKPTRLSFEKTKQELSISASSASARYRKMKIDVTKVPLLSAGREDGPIVIDVNYDRIRGTKSGFLSKLIVVSGLNKLKEAKKNNIQCSAWVGEKIKLNIEATCVSSSDLDQKLRALISATYTKKATNGSYESGIYAYIVDIYPFNSYCIFRMKDDKYRQAYKLDAATHVVTLEGKPIKVLETYVDAPTESTGITSSSPEVAESLLDKPNNAAPALGGFNGPAPMDNWGNSDILTHFGAPGSEANNPMLKLMLNVEDALSQYNHETSTGVHKVVYLPYAAMPPGLINAGREAKIAAQSIGMNLENFAPKDFLYWQDKKMRIKASERKKFVNGQTLEASQFAYIGDDHDISTWQLPIHSRKAALTSYNTLKACQFIPKDERKEVRAVIIAAAKCSVCGHVPCDCTDGGTKGGPHLGKGKSMSKAKKDMEKKRIKAGGPGSGRTCKNCNGSGKVNAAPKPGIGKTAPYGVLCPKCRGTGKLSTKKV